MTESGSNPDVLRLLEHQLARMRAMNSRYHQQFFRDVQFTTFLVFAILLLALTIEVRALVLLPFVALTGAVQTAFDASYLIFARHYATALEKRINLLVGEDALIAHRLEETYLFPLEQRKIVTLATGDGFTWFGFMTAYYTVLGLVAYAVGLIGGLTVLDESQVPIYLFVLVGLTVFALGIGVWWFVGGTSEDRLTSVLEPWIAPSD